MKYYFFIFSENTKITVVAHEINVMMGIEVFKNLGYTTGIMVLVRVNCSESF